MISSNLGYLYYKEYYTNKFIEECKLLGKKYDEKNTPLKNKNMEIIQNSNVSLYYNDKFNFINDIQDNLYEDKLNFKTIYPGVIIGTGYNHIIKETGEFKLGLEFDYTTGLPVINGSSVKGMIRSVFYNEKDDKDLKKQKEFYIKDILKKLVGENYLKKMSFKELTDNIFEGKSVGQSMPINKKDIFFGATISIEKTIREMNREKNGENLLGLDYITPHGEKKEKLNPIKFLKVMPNVVWCFGFDLKKYDEIITSDIKKNLFKQILLDLGIGAKTNVGYGRLEEI